MGLWALGQRLDAAFFLTAVGGAMVPNVLAKTMFGRARPALWTTLDPAPFYSFPSGHAMGSAALAVALGFLVASRRGRWPVWVLGGLFQLGVDWSRVCLGVHFPSDVLAGWVGPIVLFLSGRVAGLGLAGGPSLAVPVSPLRTEQANTSQTTRGGTSARAT